MVGHGSKGGWDKFGPERLVTRSSANVLFELDNKPALTLYKEYLGDLARTIDVGPLPPDAVSELARRMGVPELSERIIARTGGHSLFVMETLRAISEGTP